MKTRTGTGLRDSRLGYSLGAIISVLFPVTITGGMPGCLRGARSQQITGDVGYGMCVHCDLRVGSRAEERGERG